ncbi:HAD hydrolase family protein [Streptomyces sp. L2]|uniref:HAD hydrolase family protein n=1 Tax=Streptomyces sp. L2 TaxID=2162665 RepID=UPI00240E6BDC|nr:HAD hydrolase family protein [Streptomyces sp. L2]
MGSQRYCRLCVSPGTCKDPGERSAHALIVGDYLNDLEMLDAADWSFAMANAHPEVVRRARHLAPSNNDNGVLRTVARVLDIPHIPL